jgi:hypothetical protein
LYAADLPLNSSQSDHIILMVWILFHLLCLSELLVNIPHEGILCSKKSPFSLCSLANKQGGPVTVKKGR